MPIQRHLLAYSTPTVAVTAYNRELDRKEYELKDHLGNIHTTVKDYKVPIVTTSASNDVVFQEKFDAGTASGFVAATLPAGTIVDNIGNALRVYGSATGAAAQKTIPLTIASPGQYVLSFDYNAGTCSDAQFVISNLTPSIGSTLGNIQLSGRYDFVLNVPSSITTLDLSFVYQDASAGKSFYIDNILIKKIDEPNALPLSVIADENFSTPSNWIGTNTIIDYSAGTLNIKKDPAYISSSFFATKSVNLLQDQLYKITFSVTALAMGTSSLSLAFENDENTSGFDYNTPLSNSAIITYTYYVVPKTNLVNMVFNIKNTSGTFSCDIDNFKIQHVVSPLQPMYIAVMNNLTDYYAFGMPTPGRKYQASNRYRYGFNGKENDPETVGTGSGTQDYGMRIYNPSLGRFLSVDPIGYDYPWNSTYAFAENEPISNIDLDGLEKRKANICNINKCWNGRNNKPKSGHVSHFDLKTAVSKLNRKIHKLTRKEDIEKKQNSNLPNNKTKEAYKEQKEQKEKSPSEPQGNDNKPKERDGVVTVPDMFNSYATGDVYQDKNSVDFHSKVDEGNTLVKNVQKAIDNFKNPDDAEVNIVIGGDDVSEEVKQKRGDEIKKKLQDGGYKGTINVSTNGGNVPVQIMGVDGDADKKTENGTKIEN